MAKAQYSAKDKKFSAVVSFGESLKLVDPLGISGLIIQQHNISFSMSKKAGKSVRIYEFISKSACNMNANGPAYSTATYHDD